MWRTRFSDPGSDPGASLPVSLLFVAFAHHFSPFEGGRGPTTIDATVDIPQVSPRGVEWTLRSYLRSPATAGSWVGRGFPQDGHFAPAMALGLCVPLPPAPDSAFLVLSPLPQLGMGWQCLRSFCSQTGEVVALKKVALRRLEDGIPSQALREIKALQEMEDNPYVSGALGL